MKEVSRSYAPYLFLNDHIFMQRIAIDEIIIFHKIKDELYTYALFFFMKIHLIKIICVEI